MANYTTRIQQIIENQNCNGGPFWSREDGDIYHPSGYWTIDTLEVLGELGATAISFPILKSAVNFLFDYQTVDGAFKNSKHVSKLPCMTARILAAFGKLNVRSDNRLKRGFQYLLDIHRNDGSWRCNTVKLGKSPETDASNPGTTLYVLDAFRFRETSDSEKRMLKKGIDFLLDHWISRRPLGSCTFGIGSRFFQIEFPWLRYNIFYYIYVLSFYKYAIHDDRFKEAYTTLGEKIVADEVIPENPHRAWREFDFAKKGNVSELASYHWKSVLNNVE